MLRRLVLAYLSIVLVSILLFGASAVVVAQGQPEQPEVVLSKIYSLYGQNGTGLFHNQKLVQVYCSEKLARLLATNRRALDFDPIVNGQDWEITDLRITPTGGRAKNAFADVTFKNFGNPVKLTYNMVHQDGAWRVDDIVSEDKNSSWILTKLLDKKRR